MATDEVTAKGLVEQWPENPWGEMVDIPDGTKQYRTSSFAYFVMDDPELLSIDKYMQFQKRTIEMAYTAEWGYFAGRINKAISYAQEGTKESSYFVVNVLLNLLQSMTDMDNKHPIALLICTLFILREGESVNTYDPVLALEKIKDWQESKLSIRFFLRLAEAIAGESNARLEPLFRALQEIPASPTETTNRVNALSQL